MNEITASELRAPTKTVLGAQCVDVRSASEYASGHLPGAVNIPMEQIEARLDDFSRDAPVVLICQSGKRARIVARLLEPYKDHVMILNGARAPGSTPAFLWS